VDLLPLGYGERDRENVVPTLQGGLPRLKPRGYMFKAIDLSEKRKRNRSTYET
jgi:hypothetical protein